MPDYSSITTSANPFKTTGLSDEVHSALSILLWAKSTGLDVVCTSTTDHPLYTSSGNLSRHRRPGTNGEGLAYDVRNRKAGTASGLHRAVFDLFRPVEHHLHELIYAYAPYNIKNGKRVAPYSVSGHKDHVHASWDKGIYLGVLYPFPELPVERRIEPMIVEDWASVGKPAVFAEAYRGPFTNGEAKYSISVSAVNEGGNSQVEVFWRLDDGSGASDSHVLLAGDRDFLRLDNQINTQGASVAYHCYSGGPIKVALRHEPVRSA